LGCETASLPVAWRLYLPKEWADDDQRRAKAGVPDDIGFATKTQIALEQLEHLLAEGAPQHCVLADAGYGVDNAFRQRLSDLGLSYVVGITSAVVVWPPGVEPLPPKPYTGIGRPPVMPRRTRSRQPLSVKTLAHTLAGDAYRQVSWREGTNETLHGRFAAVRVRHAGGNVGRARLREPLWLLIEWPTDDADPLKYYLSNLPADTTLEELVRCAQMRRRIERDYQELKQELGLGHYEGRGWRGFHHHAALSIAAYGFLVSERLRTDKMTGSKKNAIVRQIPSLPTDYIARGSPARAAARTGLDRDDSPRTQLQAPRKPRSLPVLRSRKSTTTLVTQ